MKVRLSKICSSLHQFISSQLLRNCNDNLGTRQLRNFSVLFGLIDGEPLTIHSCFKRHLIKLSAATDTIVYCILQDDFLLGLK